MYSSSSPATDSHVCIHRIRTGESAPLNQRLIFLRLLQSELFPGLEAEVGVFLESFDGVKILYRAFRPQTVSRADVVLIHGFGVQLIQPATYSKPSQC